MTYVDELALTMCINACDYEQYKSRSCGGEQAMTEWTVGQEVVVWPTNRYESPKLTTIARVMKRFVVTDDGAKWLLSGQPYGIKTSRWDYHHYIKAVTEITAQRIAEREYECADESRRIEIFDAVRSISRWSAARVARVHAALMAEIKDTEE